MVLGLKTNRASVEVIIHIQEVKPWPTPRAALIQWEYGERASGFTNQVMPSHGRIEFNESFRLRHEDSYQRNCIELSVYEARRDTRGGQLMGTAVVDLGVIKENVSISTPIKCKRNHRNSPQPLLFLKIQGADDDVKKASSTSRKETRKVPQNLNLNLDVEGRINVLEGELRDAAALELSLYSVAAQHGSSMNKVHAPARRLSRLYFHANKHSGTGSVVSGLIVVAKACGNDVPRLTFWLSNTIILRAIISKPPHEMGKGPVAFAAALEKVEAWIFSRIIESLWWQTFTPHMHSIRNSDTTKSSSLELWKKAFKDACERICPVRGGDHDCGCLPLLSTLIMQQLVARLDVAMFNAILRESADEIPTDPVADPISDANVLPIPAGKASFGAGAQLKNTIGNWSRWLTDLFGMDDDDDDGDDRSSKAFCLLNELSDLMMLPKDLLSSPSIRKEVCPTFGLPLLRRILNSFVPDEFCPDPIPGPVLEALNSEDNDQDSIASHPCEAAAVAYQSPSAHSVASIMGASQLASLLKKSHTSDDELDQLDSPIIMESSRSKHNTSPSSSVRYQLLRQVWKE